jgi:hypothetical protein
MSRTEEMLSLRAGDVVAFVGGGGKTTLLLALATRLSAEGRKVLVTATRPFALRPRESPPLLVPGERPLAPNLGEHGALTVAPGTLPDGRLAGFAPERIADLAGLADYVLVEAEDAGGSSLPPVPAAPRPVPPCATHLCAVAGLDALAPDLDAEAFARRLLAPGGLLGERTDLPRRALLLSKADGKARRAAGAEVYRRLLSLAGPGGLPPRVLLTSVRDFLRPLPSRGPGGTV